MRAIEDCGTQALRRSVQASLEGALNVGDGKALVGRAQWETNQTTLPEGETSKLGRIVMMYGEGRRPAFSCSRNARPRKDLVRRAQLRIAGRQPGGEVRASLEDH